GLKTLLALQRLLTDRPEGLETWLRQRKPLRDIALAREAGLWDPTKSAAASERATVSTMARPVVRQSVGAQAHKTENVGDRFAEVDAPRLPPSILIGRRLIGGQTGKTRVPALDLLPRHTAILAGSGSGKTLLLRRIVEEAALQGIPSIVLDTNNDLARF